MNPEGRIPQEAINPKGRDRFKGLTPDELEQAVATATEQEFIKGKVEGYTKKVTRATRAAGQGERVA